MRSCLPFALALACLAAWPAAGQVRQSGNVTPGHAAQWVTSGVLQDAGTSLSGSLTTLGITANGGTPFCINSGPITAAYEQFCLGISSAGAGTISLGSFGGAPTPVLSIAVNGVATPLISSLIAGTGIAITGTTTPTISLAPTGTNTLLSNISGITAAPLPNSLTAILDSSFGSTTGDTLFRAASGWQVLGPGNNGNCLTYTSGGTPLAWGSCSGSGGTGTVTSITAGTGLTGGTITASGTIALSSPVAAANGGTGLSAPGSNLNALVSNGSAWTSAAVVNSVANATNGGLTLSGSTGAVTAAVDPSFFRGTLGGLVLSNDGGSPNTVVDISAGSCVDSTAAVLMKLAAFTKTTGAWTLGSGNGGLDTGSVANNTWYSVFVIQRTDTGVTDALLSTSATSPTLPANYTKFRRIGSVRTAIGTTNLLAFTQLGDDFYWTTPVVSSVTPPGSSAAVGYTVDTPLGVKTGVTFSVLVGSSQTDNMYFSSLDTTDVAASVAPTLSTQGASTNSARVFDLRTNTASQLRGRSGGFINSISLVTLGWIDSRGRYD